MLAQSFLLRPRQGVLEEKTGSVRRKTSDSLRSNRRRGAPRRLMMSGFGPSPTKLRRVMGRNISTSRLNGWPQFVAMFLVLAAAISLPQTVRGSTSTLYDFDTPGQLAEVFNSAGSGVANVSEATTGGIGNSGAITAPSSSTDAVFSTKEGYSLGPVGSTYTFTSNIKSVYNDWLQRAGIHQLVTRNRCERNALPSIGRDWDLGPWWRICLSQRNLELQRGLGGFG